MTYKQLLSEAKRYQKWAKQEPHNEWVVAQFQKYHKLVMEKRKVQAVPDPD